MQLRIACIVTCLVVSCASSGTAQLPNVEARSLGLEVAWRSQLQLPRVGRGVVSADLWVESSDPRKYAVVELADRVIRISAESLDRDGNQIGIDQAKERATQQASRILGKQTGFEVTEVDVPRIKLVVTTSTGLVQTLDAETGKLIWSTACGNSRAPAFPAAVSTSGVSVIHGEELYLLDWETGKHLKTHRLRSPTSNAVAVCDDIAFVTDFAGMVQTYDLGVERAPWTYKILGRAIGRPVNFVDQTFSAVASEDGYVYVFAGGDQPSVWIRYETSSPINGSLTAANNAFYAGTSGGVVAKISVEQRLGDIAWEYRAGEPITAPPLVVGNTVFLATESGTVFALDDSDLGLSKWSRSGVGVSEILSLAGGELFCRTKANAVLALDANTGAVIGTSKSRGLSKSVINAKNDRLYVIAEDGRLQCLRPIGAVLPTMITPFVAATEDEEEAGDQPAQTAPPAGGSIFAPPGAAADPGDIFGTDPLGGDAGGNAANPFAPDATGGGNPFDF